jgi:hypothetical protein
MPEQSLEGLNYMPPFIVGLPSDSEPSRVSNIGRAAWDDFKESDEKLRTGTSFLGVAAVQAIGFSRQPFVLVPKVAIDVLQNSNSALEAATVTGTLFGAWCFTVAETINNGVSRYPNGVKAVGKNFPDFIRHFGNALAGLEASGERVDDSRRLSSARNIGRPILRHARRGLTAVAIGIAPYVGTAGVKGQSKSQIRKLGAGLGVDGGLVIAAMSGGLAEAIVIVGHNHPEIAQQIESVTGDTKLWYGIAGILMAGEWVKNKLGDNQVSDQQEEPIA